MKKNGLRQVVLELSYHPKERVELFRSFDEKQQVSLLKKLSHHVLKDLTNRLPTEELIALLEKMDPDEATDIVRLLSKKHSAKVIEGLNERLKQDITMLLSFKPDTAADLMSLNYIIVEENEKIADLSEKVLTHEKRTGKLPVILVVSDQHKLLGFIPGFKLAIAKMSETAGKHLSKIATINFDTSEKDVLDFFSQHPHSKVVVLGSSNNILGIIYSDDVIKLMQDEEASALYDFAGVNEEESVYDSSKRKVKFRHKWLLINLATSFLAAFTVSLFHTVIEKQVLLAVYMPIVAGMGGNAGTQTLAVMVRGLADNDLGWKDIGRTLKNELRAAFVNGAINGIIVFLILAIFNRNVLVGLVLGIAMVANLMVSATFGTLVPVILKKAGKDPASSATVFITTATDVLGFMVFLGLATILLR